MNHLPTGLFLATAVAAAFVFGALPIAAAQTSPAGPATVQFGMDANAVAAQVSAGVAPDYGTFWVGPWTLSSGWSGPDAQLASLRSAGVTPAIHFYYWGDDISPSCVENGCWSSLHNAQKTRAGWETLGNQLTSHLTSKMGGEPVVVFLESEFNKGGISTYEPFDGYMAAMADKIHAGYPNAIVVLGFGAWDSGNWYRFDQAAAASDMVGVQAMRGSTRDTAAHYNNIYEGTLASVQKLESLFGQPIMLTDVALSSYPEPSYLAMQADNLGQIFDNLGTLKAHGVEAMIYRSWRDSPNMDLANYYGEAERHWGLAYPDNTQKAAGKVWVAGVKAERASAAPVNHAPTAAFAASGSNLLVSVDGSASSDPDGDALTYAWTYGDGATATGRTASHAYAAAGTYTIGLKVSDGALSASASKTVTVTKPVTTTSTTTTTAAAYTATVTPSSSSNEWWVQVGVSPAPAKVEVKVGSGAFTTMDKQSYGYTKNTHVAKGTMVQFRVTSTSGQTATTPAQAWLVDMSAKTATSGSTTQTTSAASTPSTASATTTSTPAATVKVTPSGNEWWVQASVSSTKAITKVEAKAGSGNYVALSKESYGWAKSFHVAKGTMVQFRLTASDGTVATTAPQAWLVDMSAKTATFGSATSTTTTTTGATATKTTTTTTASSTTAPAFKAAFAPRSVGNDWWVETAVSANAPVAKVEAKVNNGAYVTLPKQDWGTYAKSIHAPNGSQVTFRATSDTGATSTSAAVKWT